MKKSIFLKQILQFREKPNYKVPQKYFSEYLKRLKKLKIISHTRAEIFSPHGYIFLQIFPIFMHLSKTVEKDFKNKYAE